MDIIFITGSTGFLGSYFVNRLLDESNSCLYLLIRSKRKANELKCKIRSDYHRRINFVYGDITEPEMGIGVDTLGFLRQNTIEIWHIAAITDLNAEETFSRLINEEGTQHVIGFAQKADRLKKFYHISTAYTCGRRPDEVVYECILEAEKKSFKNIYEETKHNAEIFVRDSHLPWVILRPSIVVGDSKTGVVESTKMMYGVIRSYHVVKKMIQKELERSGESYQHIDRTIRMEACAPITKNIICVDDVVAQMLLIRNSNPNPGSIYHLTNPISAKVIDIHESICHVLDTPFIRLVPQLGINAVSTEEKLLKRGTKVYKQYLFEDDPVFDTRKTAQLIGQEYPCKVPDRKLLDFLFKEYYENELLEKKLETDGENSTFEQRYKALQRYMNNSISYFTTGNNYNAFSIPEVDGYLPYIQLDNTSVIIGDPVTNEDNYEIILEKFMIEMNMKQISITGLQLSKRFARLFEEYDYYVNCLGIETFVSIKSFSLSGNRMKKLRQNVNTSERYGITVIEQDQDSIDIKEVEKVSQQWISNKESTHELSVIIRPLSNSIETEVRRFFAYYQGKLVGFIFFNPIYRNSRTVGYLSDIERYLHRPPGIHDYIIYKAIQLFKKEPDLQYVSLGLSPFEDIDLHEGKAYNRRTKNIIKSIRNEENPVYSFKNVSKHKKLYKGIEKPLYYASSKSEVNIDLVNLFHAIGIITPKSLLNTSDALFNQLV